MEVEVEVMDFFLGGGGDLGMLDQVVVQGCCAAFLDADDDEIGGFGRLFHGFVMIFGAWLVSVWASNC